MTYSAEGFNGMSRNFHDFINAHIVSGEWKGKERPVLINNWESNFFDFSRRSLLRLARRAKELGVELFVLDDGWFGARNNDRAGLGDYDVNLNSRRISSLQKNYINGPYVRALVRARMRE